MSSILSALAPNRSSSGTGAGAATGAGPGGADAALGKRTSLQEQSLVQAQVDASAVGRIELPLLSKRGGQKIFKLTSLLSKATLSPNEGKPVRWMEEFLGCLVLNVEL